MTYLILVRIELGQKSGREPRVAIIAAAETMPAVADLQVSSVETEIRPRSFDRPIEEGVDPFINVFAQVGDLALRMPDRPIARTKSSTPRVETLPIQASWMTGLALSPRSCAAQDSAEVRAFVPTCADQ